MTGPQIRRGAVWLVDWRGRGSEQYGRRPSLIIQRDAGNRRSNTTIIAAITTTIRAYPFMVRIPAGIGGLEYDSAVNLTQIITVDKSRLLREFGALPAEYMRAVTEALHVSLGLEF